MAYEYVELERYFYATSMYLHILHLECLGAYLL